MPFFSITMPVYNVEKYIKQSINSVLSQKYTDFELIILDDGSTDTSGEICDEYMQKDARIRVYHEANRGLLMARRRALQYVTGEYVLFLDSDDYWESNLLETVYKALCNKKYDLVMFRYQRVDDHGNIYKIQKPLLNNGVTIKTVNEFLIYKLASTFQYNAIWLKVVKRDVLDIEQDYSELEEISIGEDVLQTIPIAEKAEEMLYIDEVLYNYRMNQSSMTQNLSAKYLYDYFIVRGKVTESLIRNVSNKKKLKMSLRYFLVGLIKWMADISASGIDRKRWYVEFEYMLDEKKKIVNMYTHNFHGIDLGLMKMILKCKSYYLYRFIEFGSNLVLRRKGEKG